MIVTHGALALWLEKRTTMTAKTSKKGDEKIVVAIEFTAHFPSMARNRW